MENEKNFFIAIIITLIVLLAYPMVAQRLFPQYFEKNEVAEKEFEAPRPAARKETLEQPESVFVSAADREPKLTSDHFYTIENDKFIVNISREHADVRSLRLKSFYTPKTGLPVELVAVSSALKGVFHTAELTEHATLEKIIPSDNAIRFIFNKQGVGIIKTIGFTDVGYGLTCDISIKNNETDYLTMRYDIIAAHHFSTNGGMDSRFNEAVILFSDKKMHKKNVGNIAKETAVRGEPLFAGIKTRYFSTILIPEEPANSAYYAGMKQHQARDTLVGLRMPETTIAPAQTITHRYTLFSGPNIHEEMAIFQANIEHVRGRGVMAGLSELLLLLLRFLYRILGNYGIAVIGLALLTNIALYPLTFKSMSSMREMQSIQPLVKKLQDEHKGNPQKLNKEIMELYKKHKVNPAGGCLPMLLQMPVFFALYGVLMTAIELRGASFLWIKDLSSPDAFIVFTETYPFIGNSLNILPFIMVAVSFIQQKRTTAGQVNDQQKLMATMMPVILGVIFYNFPSGLVLYFLTNTIFSFFVQMRIVPATAGAAS